jgi:hypothetical protein
MDEMNHKPTLYESGSMEFSKDPNTWRNKMYAELCDLYDVIVPIAKFCPYNKSNILYREWIKKEFVIPDMEYVLKCDHFFVKLDKAVARGSGTYGELTLAAYLNKPIVYMLDNIKIEDLPGWSIGCLYNATEVANIDEAVKYYKNLLKIKGE